MKMTLSQLGVQFSIHIAEMVKVLLSKKPVFPLCDRLMDCGVQAGLCLRGFEAAEPPAQKEAAMQAAAFAPLPENIRLQRTNRLDHCFCPLLVSWCNCSSHHVPAFPITYLAAPKNHAHFPT